MIFSKNLKRHQILHGKNGRIFFSNLLLRLISLNDIIMVINSTNIVILYTIVSNNNYNTL